MSGRYWMVPTVVLAIAAVGAAIFFTTFERKEVDSYTPAHDEAVANPLFALEQTLRSLGRGVFSTTQLRFGQRILGTMVFSADVTRLDAEQARSIKTWVEQGGHLVVHVDRPSVDARAPLFAQWPLLSPRDVGQGCQSIHVDDGVSDINYCGQRFTLAGQQVVDAALGDAKGYLYARLRVGAGWISLLSNVSPLRNEGMRDTQQRHLVRQLLEPNFDHGATALVYALDGPSFLLWVITEGWPALLALLLALVGWALMRGERLGPLIPAPPLQRRALLEHVQATGEFLYRRDSGRSLHRLACDTALARARRIDPLCAALDGEALYARLAERHRLDPAQVARAFHPPANALAFRDSLAVLARLRSRP